ncbi:hypothetical protein XaC1_138 [Xanthomonas phage XaC1]|nr:hypothetical protein XaC1_138 [Xanthomonas phage XaC1]
MRKKTKKILIVKGVLKSNGKVMYTAMHKTIFGWKFVSSGSFWWDSESKTLDIMSQYLSDYEIIHCGTTILN